MKWVAAVVVGALALTGAYWLGAQNRDDEGKDATAASTPTTRATADHDGDGHAMEHEMDGMAGADPADFDDKGLSLLENGEMSHQYGPDVPLDEATRERLAHQLALTRVVADRFPTLADAKAAGSTPAGAYGPGLGLHMSFPPVAIEMPPSIASVPPVNGELSDEEILHPSNLMYAGSDDDAKLAGFMYYVMTPGEPEGFAGPNDHWHTHGSLCIEMGDDGIHTIQTAEKTTAACEAAGGMFIERTMYMVHVWTVPGYESNRGVFSDVNPSLACSDGTYYLVAEEDRDRYDSNHCLADAQ
jgi:hypothetical protein